MSIWTQIGDQRTTAVPPDGKTIIDVYADFTFSGQDVPDGTTVSFLIGKSGGGFDPNASQADIVAGVSPITGIELFANSAPVAPQFVRDTQGALTLQHVANVQIKPIADTLKDNITVVAFCTFDKLGLVKRFSFSSTVLTVSGGEGVFLSSLEQYDPVGDVWATKTAMPTGRSGPFCQTVANKIYAIGGFNSNFTGIVEQYDPTTDVWATKNSMTIPRAFGSSVVVANEIYTIGGCTFSPGRASNVLEKYTPGSDTWTTLAPMPIPLGFTTAQTVGSKIYVFFGASKFDDKNNPINTSSGVLQYDIIGNIWTLQDAVFAGAGTTTLSANAPAGAFILEVPVNAALPGSGFLTVNRGAGNQETVYYTSFQSGVIVLQNPLVNTHVIGESVTDANIPRTRLASNSYFDGSSTIKIMNGSNLGGLPNGLVESYNTTTKASVLQVQTTNFPRYKAAQTVLGSTLYMVDGSSPKSDYSDKIEKTTIPTDVFVGPTGLAKALFFRTSAGASYGNNGSADFVYVMGGQGDGHSPGWLKLTVTTNPDEIRADGRQTATATLTAVDAGGDPPPDSPPVAIKARGLIYISSSQAAAAKAADQAAAGSTTTSAGVATQSSSGAATANEKNPPPTISILPVLFSAQNLTMVGGIASTVLLPRSEDFINEVQNLLSFAKANEVVVSQDALKAKAASFANQIAKFGDSRELYKVAIEFTIKDSFFFGQTDSEATAAEIPDTSLASSNFSINPTSAKQGSSGKVGFFSDITSMPDVEVLTASPVDLPTVTQLLDGLKDEIPFGASPHFDALFTGAQQRLVPPPALPLLPPKNIMLSASDNEDSGSANSAADVADEVNLVDGANNFPVFITTVVVTDPLSLAARAARTDVADLELISSETGGNSFSLDRPEYINFIIDRIKTSAPSSIGSGSFTVLHAIDGAITLLRFVVDNMIAGNTATMTARYSVDGYNFIDIKATISAPVGVGPQTTTFTLATPIQAKFIEYTIKLTSSSFNSPILNSISIQFVQPAVQYYYTFPQTVGGQVTELAAVTNECLPAGGTVTVGLVHGDSLEFERDYVSVNQPGIKERGTIMAINRSFDTIIDGAIFRDKLQSDDFLIYTSKSGPWAQDAITRIFVNEIEALPSDFIAVPENGTIVFRKRLAPTDVVTLEVENPSTFRVALKIENPALQVGTLDDFAFMYGESEQTNKLKPNHPPAAINLFISPTPIFAGGTLTANYTFVDPDGDAEDTTQTEIIWFRNSTPVTELKNLKTFSNTDLIARRNSSTDNIITHGQEWFFTVRPSDGKAFGALAVSQPITVATSPPTGTNAVLKSSNTDPLKFTSSDSITASFTYTDNDGIVAAGSVYTFFVNGLQVKTGTDDTLFTTDQDASGNNFIKSGATVRCDILPSNGTDFGQLVSSNTITIGSSTPIAANVSILPVKPSAASSLNLTYQFTSIDKLQDQSTIAWFADNVRNSNFDNLTQIPRGNIKPGQQWFAIVTPFDGNTQGDPVKSNVVLIQN